MIIVGGLTRLTESGLSMVDWRLFMGTIPPLSHGDWLKVFEDYKQYPEYQIKNINMTLSEFKYIFWWEYGHRVLGRLIGIIFIIPFIYFALKKYFSNEELYSYSFLLFLGGAQGIIGWWMVKSGLDVNPYVSHLRLAVHLIIAQIILSLIAYLFLKRLNIGIYKNNFSSHKTFFIFFNIIIFFTVIYGAFMAGLDAGKSFNTWPKMGDNYIPENLIFIEDRLFGFFDNSVFIHFFHRALAYLSFLTILYMCFKHFKGIENKYQKIHFLIVLFLVLIQLFIGVFVVLSNVQVSLGSIHQIIGTLLFVSATCYSLQILKN
jgi:cytochrome c oxidase assembly protein subunit 15|tara:strand:- start:2746 stop:3699 length:954 start_codon:yes stop_codon:yes gene_type:complete